MGNPDPGDNKWPPASQTQGWHGDPGWWRSPSAHGGGCLGGPGGEGRAERHRQHCQALFSPIVLHFLPACALRWCPHGCPHGNRVTAAISHLLPARGTPGPPSVCVLLPQTPLPPQQQQQPSLATPHSGRCHCGPWGRVVLGHHGGHPALCPPSLMEGTSDVTQKKCALGL